MNLKLLLSIFVMIIGLIMILIAATGLQKKPPEPIEICFPSEEIESACALKCSEFNEFGSNVFVSFNTTNRKCLCMDTKTKEKFHTSLLEGL